MNVQKQEKGFTIIEVVLVLAIAALIFLMIFIALPALQRGQRDTARRSDANTVAAAANTWRSNHRGSLPDLGDNAVLTEFRNNYVKQLNQYSRSAVLELTGTDAANPSINQVQVRTGRSCPSDGGSGAGAASSRSAQVYVKLEASNAIICVDA